MVREILIIDDDEISIKTIARRFEKRGLTVRTFFNAPDCLKYIENNPHVVILLDIMMPEMDGVTALKLIRKKHTKAELPVVMLTAKDEVEDIVECLEFGANDYLKKPINIDVAFARVSSQLDLLEYHEDSLKKEQLEVVKSMVTTYNHEINNPLTIALCSLKKGTEEKNIVKAIESLNRIKDIVQKIAQVTEKGYETEEYYEDVKKVKLT